MRGGYKQKVTWSGAHLSPFMREVLNIVCPENQMQQVTLSPPFIQLIAAKSGYARSTCYVAVDKKFFNSPPPAPLQVFKMRDLEIFDMSVPLKIQVETEVQIWEESTTDSHDLPCTTTSTITSPRHPQPTSFHFLPTSSSRTFMSLPRANYDPRRVCLNPFPEFTFGKRRRAIGVYLAGALVRCGIVLGSELDAERCMDSLPWRIGLFWTLRSCLLMQNLLGETNQTPRRPSTSHSSTGFRESALC